MLFSLLSVVPSQLNSTICTNCCIYRVSQEECARLRKSVPYVKVYQYNPKHLYPKLNGYGDNGQRKVRCSCGSTYCACSADALRILRPCPWDWNAVNIVPALWKVCYLYVVAKKTFMFFHAKYCDMHFVHGFCNGNARAVVAPPTLHSAREEVLKWVLP